ncbi:hypothetical protein NC651_011470 [Populus alba x Populus x berolinensis]|nr:hypothetical protein NC651_011470 [Populus alba x Populus x berolinensis]
MLLEYILFNLKSRISLFNKYIAAAFLCCRIFERQELHLRLYSVWIKHLSTWDLTNHPPSVGVRSTFRDAKQA